MNKLAGKKFVLILVLALAGTFLFSSLVFAHPFGFRGHYGPWTGNGLGVEAGGYGAPWATAAGAVFCGGAGSANSMMALIGQILDLDWRELQAARWRGESWAEIAAQKGVAKETLVEEIVAESSAFWQELVDAGVMTAEEKAAAETRLKERAEYLLDESTAPGRGCGMRGFRGMRGGYGAGFSQGAW